MTKEDSVKLAAVAKTLREAISLLEGGSQRAPVAENASVEFLLNVLQAEWERLNAEKKDLAKKESELSLKLTFAQGKEKELVEKEAAISKLEAQLRVREGLLLRREKTLKDQGR